MLRRMTTTHASPSAMGSPGKTRQPSRHSLPRVSPVLIFTWGNPSRGDDAIGPYLKERLDTRDISGIELLTDFQLQIEHITDLAYRTRVIFIDASVSAPPPFEFTEVGPEEDSSYSTHAMSPHALLAVYRRVYGEEPPPCFLLSVRGYDFRLGHPMSGPATRNAGEALQFILGLIDTGLDWKAVKDTP